MKYYTKIVLLLILSLFSCKKDNPHCINEGLFCQDVNGKNWKQVEEITNSYLHSNSITSIAIFESYLNCKSCVKKIKKSQYTNAGPKGPAVYSISFRLKDEILEKDIYVYYTMNESEIIEIRFKE